ncbi:MAG: phage tail length tape measure family protein [Proteobacteria bacterium]|nr:phage tail length tape measure family protein [Pseudomonadota bacterium]
MSGNNVEFGITFTGDGKVASAEIDRVTQSADRLTQATARQNTVASESKNAWLTQTAAIKTSGDEMVSASEGVQKLLAKYDPLGAKLRSLEADFSALNKAAASGQLPASQDAAVDKTYKALNEEIAKTKTLMGQAGVAGYEAFAKVEEGANKGAFATAGAKRELMVLAHEAMSGNFSRMPGSFMVLAERMSITTALFSPLTIGAAAFGVATVGVAVAAHQGHEEMVAMNNALAVTGNYAGLTRGTMRELADSMTQTGTMTIGTAKDIVTALVASGRIGAESIAGVAKLAGNFAAATGQDVAKITPELIKLFADPAKGVEELDKRMHFLNVTDREYIAHLERIGEVGEAQRVSLEKTTAAIPKQTENIGYLGHQWDLLKQSISATGDALAAWGRTTTVNEQLANAKSLIEREGGSVSDAMRGVVPATGSKDLKEAYALVAALQQQADAERAKGVEAGKVAATREKEALAQKEADKSATHQITILRDSLTLLASAPDSAEKTRREFELRKQILDVQRSIGAEGRQLSQEEISYQEKLREVAVKVGTDEIEAQYKLGQVDVVRRDAMLLFYALKSNKSKQTAEEELLLVGNLTAAEKKQHQDKLKILQVEADAIIAAGANKALIDEKKFYDDIRKSVDALGSSEIAALDKTIAAQRLHNAEIGKTPEQIARVKKAAEDFGTAQLDAEAKALRAAAETVVMDQQYKDIYIARANALDIEIAKRRELATAMGDGAFLEANAAAVRKVNEDAKAFTKDVDRALTDGIMRGGKNGGKYLEDYFRTLVFRPGVQFLMSPVAGAISSAFYGAGANGMSLANAGAGAGLYGSFATSAFGQSLGLSAGASGAAAGASVAEATYAQALLTGATTVEASAAATAATTSAMTTLGAALPYIGAALVIANAVGLFGKGGGPQQGQLGTVNANGYTATQNYTGGDTLGNQALAQSAYNQVAALYVAAGKQVAGLSINQGGKLDPEGTAAALGYRQISVGGNVISGQAGWDNPAFTGAHDDAKGLATYLGKLTSDEIEQVAAAINDPKLTDAITKLKANFGDLTVAMPNYLTAQAAQKVLLDPLLTGTEKLNAAQHDLAEAGLPNTREGLKDLIKSLDLTTQAGWLPLAFLAVMYQEPRPDHPGRPGYPADHRQSGGRIPDRGCVRHVAARRSGQSNVGAARYQRPGHQLRPESGGHGEGCGCGQGRHQQGVLGGG